MKSKITLSSIVIFALMAINCSDKKEIQSTSELSDLSASTNTETLAVATPEMVAKGQEIFNGKGICYTCHKPESKLIGPSLKDIAQKYTTQNASIVSFLKQDSHPIVDTTATQVALMKTNFPTLKKMSDDELKSLEAFILSHK